MKEFFLQYIGNLYKDVPSSVYAGLLSVFCIVVVICVANKGGKKEWRLLFKIVFAEFLFLIYSTTIIFRTAKESVEYHFSPFWSYFAYDKVERPELLLENIMNVMVFIPLGFLFSAGFYQMKWWKVMLVGLCISLSIEILQYFFKLGVAEFDDVMHNTLGCLLGYLFFMLLKRLIK